MKEVEFVAKHSGAWIKDYLRGVMKERGSTEYHRLRNAVMIERERLNQQHAEINAGKAEPTHYQSLALGG